MNIIQKGPLITVLFISLISGQIEDFVGSAACKSCHSDQFELWENSTHGRAGGSPADTKIKAPFDGKKIILKNGWFIPYKEDGRYFFKAQENEFPEVKFEVIGVVGGGHIYGGGTQSFFGLFPDGTMRLLPFDYHPGNKTWFFETNNLLGWQPASEKLSMRNLSEWPPNRTIGAIIEKKNCQQCHGSQIIVGFDNNRGKYKTLFTELTINCESCHGPGKEHLSLMQFGKSIVKGYTGIQSLKTLSKKESVAVCAQCHALKDLIRPGYLPGMDFEDFFSTKFSMLGGNPYFPDGRVKAFGYQQNHIFSDCFLNGSMTCVDCHNPHSNGYQDINRAPLEGRFDNGQCLSCHVAKANNIRAHTFHKIGSQGSQCTSCHMPFQQHEAVGSQLKFSRADHTISIPRPKLDEKLGVKNACQQCHKNLSIQAIADQMQDWYGELKPLHQLESALIAFETADQLPGDLLNLIGTNMDPYPQVFAGLATAFMSDQSTNQYDKLIQRLKHLCENNDLDIRGVALAYLNLFSEKDKELDSFIIQTLTNAGREQIKIRTRWSIALAYKAERLTKSGLFPAGIEIYNKSISIWPKNDRAKKGLAEAYIMVGDIPEAVKTYGTIVQSDVADWQGWAGLANAQAQSGQLDVALEAYMRSLEINVYNAPAHLGIGNILFKMKNDVLAEKHLAKAIELDPAMTEAYIYLAAIKVRGQDFKGAALVLNRGLILDPAHEIGNMMKRELSQLD